MAKYSYYSTVILRVLLGLLFFVSGLFKLSDFGNGISITIGNIGFPFPMFWAWLVLICEIVFGFLVIFGIKMKYSIWPLIVILTVAIFGVNLPRALENPASVMGWSSVIFNLIVMSGLIDLSLRFR